MDPSLPSVRDSMRAARQHRKLSARALSLGAGLSPSYISKVEAGEIEPSLRAFARVAKRLQLGDKEIVFIVAAAAR